MSQNIGQQQNKDKDSNRPSIVKGKLQQALGFDGMNYEQIREPYCPTKAVENKPGGNHHSSEPSGQD